MAVTAGGCLGAGVVIAGLGYVEVDGGGYSALNHFVSELGRAERSGGRVGV
jgi:hypothetical protein